MGLFTQVNAVVSLRDEPARRRSRCLRGRRRYRGCATSAIRSPSIYASSRRSGRNVGRWIGDLMTVDTAHPSVFDAGLPTLDYDLTTTPAQLYPLLLAAQQQAPIALGPFGPEFISYELVRAVLRDSRFQVPPGLNL